MRVVSQLGATCPSYGWGPPYTEAPGSWHVNPDCSRCKVYNPNTCLPEGQDCPVGMVKYNGVCVLIGSVSKSGPYDCVVDPLGGCSIIPSCLPGFGRLQGTTDFTCYPLNGQPVYDVERNCVVQPDGRCVDVKPELVSLTKKYGVSDLYQPQLSADGSHYTGPPVLMSSRVPAVLSLGPRYPTVEEAALILKMKTANTWATGTIGDTKIYDFDLGGTHFAAFYYPDNAFTRSLPGTQPWMLGTISIQPWLEGAAQIWSVALPIIKALILPFLALNEWLIDVVVNGIVIPIGEKLWKKIKGFACSSVGQLAAEAAAQAEGLPPGAGSAVLSSICGNGGGGGGPQPKSSTLPLIIGAVALVGLGSIAVIAARRKP